MRTWRSTLARAGQICVRRANRVPQLWADTRGLSTMLLFMVWMPFATFFGIQYVLQLHFIFQLQQECSAIVDNAAVLGARDIDWASYLQNSPKLSTAQAQADVAASLSTGFSNISTYLTGAGYGGLATWVGNPGDTDPFTGRAVTQPTVHIQGSVSVDPLGNGTTRRLFISQSALANITH